MLERVWRKGNPLTLLVGIQTSMATMENNVEIPLKTGNRTAIWPNNPIAGHTHQGNQNWERHMHPNAWTWKQPRTWKQPSADEWIRKLQYIYTMEHYSAIIKKTFQSGLIKWIKLEPIIQSEISQKEKYQYSIMRKYRISENGNIDPISKTAKETDR